MIPLFKRSPLKHSFSIKNFSSTPYQKVLTKDTISEHVKAAEYAVRGKIPLRGEEIMKEIRAQKGDYPFEATTALNIGNP